MSRDIGVWIDHQKAVIVRVTGDEISESTFRSGVGAHPRYSGSENAGGEKQYEARNTQDLNRYYDEVIGHLGTPDAVLLFGPGEAKLELRARLDRSALAGRMVAVETADALTDSQIVARVRDHFTVLH